MFIKFKFLQNQVVKIKKKVVQQGEEINKN